MFFAFSLTYHAQELLICAIFIVYSFKAFALLVLVFEVYFFLFTFLFIQLSSFSPAFSEFVHFNDDVLYIELVRVSY